MKKQHKALLSLGYTKPEINSVLKKAGNMTNTEDIIKICTQRIILKLKQKYNIID